jgi:hypothetical protein
VTRIVTIVGVAAAAALVLTAPTAAQGDEMPTELWAEYPLVQEVEGPSTPTIGPFLPPADPGSAPATGDAPAWGLWALVAALGLVALLVATRVVRTAPAGARRRHEAPVQLRPEPQQRPSAARGRPLTQYAPSPSLVLEDAPEEPRRSVVRRTGLLRSRYVVLEGRTPGKAKAVAASKGFWNVGGDDVRERAAEDAWDELVNDLRVAGWEPEPTRRSDFYILLQPIEHEEPSPSIIPTLDAYGRGDDSVDD